MTLDTHMITKHAFIALACLSEFLVPAQSPTWLLRTSTIGATPRFDHALAYDSTRQRIVMFGGTTGTSLLADTVEWNGGDSAWVVRAPATSPAARSQHAMTFDAARQRVVLFGGEGTSGHLGDTWEWNGSDWQARTPAASPGARRNHALAYDSNRQRVVMFGGRNNTTVLGDTWEWDGTNWIATFPPVYPSPRSGHAMTFDASRHVTVLFGGSSGATWEWDGMTWLAHTSPTTPAATSDVAMTYESIQQRVLLFGGGAYSAQTWEWNGQDWVQALPAQAPVGRIGHAMVFDTARHRTILFGGRSQSLIWGDTWDYRGPYVPATATPYGTGCGQPPLGFVPDSNARPVLGQSARALVTDAPTLAAAVALGWNNLAFGPYQLPVTLTGIGMNGCDLLQSSDILGLGTSPIAASTLSFSVALPNNLALLDRHVYLQAYAMAPGANALGLVASNAIDWRLGNL